MAIAMRDTDTRRGDLWARIAAPLAPSTIAWRQDGRAVARDGKFFARFVCYVEAGTVRERLDAVVPGEWDLTLDPLPQQTDEDGVPMVAFKAKLQILGVVREDVGQGKDYKSAATDAFKRAAVRFGIGHELYAMEQNWVQVDSDSKFAKPVEDPSLAYARRHGAGITRPSAPPEREERKPAPAKAEPVPTIQQTNAAGAFLLPFGKSKGTPLCEMERRDLEGALGWAKEKGKYVEFQVAAAQYLNSPQSEDDHLRDYDEVEIPF